MIPSTRRLAGSLCAPLLLPALLLLPSPAAAGPFSRGSDSSAQEDLDWHLQREADVEQDFQAIMSTNSAPQAAEPARPAQGGGAPNALIGTSGRAPVDDNAAAAGDGTVTIALDRWEAARRSLSRADRAQADLPEHLVVLGASTYRGEASASDGAGGVLKLTLDLQVSLYGEGLWKTVPLVGDEVVVVAARVDGRAVPLSSRSGYHVWVTQETGEVSLTVDLLVPSRGRRGSLEYELPVARTPVTRFTCDFPTAGLEPRLRGAVQAQVQATDGGTRLSALLSPTSRIHLVGFKDMGRDDGREARVYAESMNLLSLDENTHELFTVIRYNILYAGQRRFDVAIPPGMSVVSADGPGAFRYTIEPDAGNGAVLRGETAYPISGSYELSLRLRRDDAGSGEPFTVGLPRSLGVEREYGWLGVEVTGTLRLEEAGREEALAVDVRQLPWEMVQSAVSPVLRAWRYHSPDARVQLRATRLPDVEPQSASIDSVVADTVLSAEGRELTDLRITLRNRLRHSLRVQLPEGAAVRSALLDGEPVKPSIAADGALLLPLKRSTVGASGLLPFTVQLVLERPAAAPGVLGRGDFALPALELPVSSLSWTAWVPSGHHWSALRSAVAPQSRSGAGQWYQAPADAGLDPTPAVGGLPGGGHGGDSANTGAMPVRIDLPKTGHRLTLARYWVEGGETVTASAWHARGWLRAPLVLLLSLLLGGGLVASGLRPPPQRWAAAAAGGVLAGALLLLAGPGVVLLTAVIGLGLLGLAHGAHRAVLPALAQWWSTESPASAWSQRHILSRLMLLATASGLGLVALVTSLRWLTLLDQPL